jgi:hypothetical protein
VSQAIDNSHFRCITPGIETLPCRFSLPRHRHLHAYATGVLAGCLEESGYVGRIYATAGDVLIHPTLDCHANRMVSAGVKLIRLADWPDTGGVGQLYHFWTDQAHTTRWMDSVNSPHYRRCARRLAPQHCHP